MGHPLLVGRPEDDHPAIPEDLLDRGDVAARLEGPHVDHAHGLVEQDLLASLQPLDLD
jgi:hypothetical protein